MARSKRYKMKLKTSFPSGELAAGVETEPTTRRPQVCTFSQVSQSWLLIKTASSRSLPTPTTQKATQNYSAVSEMCSEQSPAPSSCRISLAVLTEPIEKY